MSPSLISSSEMAFIQAAQEGALPDTCTLRQVTFTNDGSGGWSEGTSDTTLVPCRLVQLTGIEGITANALRAERTYMLTIPKSYTVTPKTRVIKGGITFEVISVNEPASWLTVKRATCVRKEA